LDHENVRAALMRRPRRLRFHPQLRELVHETRLQPTDFVYPLFIHHGQNVRREVPSLPGVFQLSVDQLAPEIDEVASLGIRAVILFGIPRQKDEFGSDATCDEGIIPQAIRAIKGSNRSVLIISDVCFCEYTDHGHCGALVQTGSGIDVDNDRTLELMAEQVLSHARSGVDMVAPSGMMDGGVAAIRTALDQEGFVNLPILAYSAKYASGFYGPFREAAESAPKFGDRSTYQMDCANRREALREVALDIEQGADVVMIKPALAYLDIIREVRDGCDVPVAAYNVSGEYAMVKAAAAKNWIDERRVTLEILTSIKRAGADLILTYHAKDAARWLA
jgi:porphobilinogen synthase